MVEEFALFLLLGKLLMFLIRKAPYFKTGFLGDLTGCELCLGVWVYSALALLFRFSVLLTFGYIPILSEIFTGAIASFVMWLLTDGWNAKFRVMYLE